MDDATGVPAISPMSSAASVVSPSPQAQPGAITFWPEKFDKAVCIRQNWIHSYFSLPEQFKKQSHKTENGS